MKDYLNEYKGYCLTCKNYDLASKSDATTRGFRCTRHGRPMAMDEKCSSYSKDTVRSNSYIDTQVRWMAKHGYDPRRDKDTFCYITTICCDILGLEDNHKYLESLRTIRNYLLSIDVGKKILLDYDVYGVLIAQKIYDDYVVNHEKVIDMINNTLIPLYFEPLTSLIQNAQIPKAVNLYVKMTFMLMKKYKIKYLPINEKNIDVNNLGHGYNRIKKYSLY